MRLQFLSEKNDGIYSRNFNSSAFTIRRVVMLFVAFASTHTTAIAQEAKQGLARPEWQLRADLEFRLACQATLQKLSLEVLQTQQKDPSDPANMKLLLITVSLLETTDGKLPTSLPEHPASIEYVKSRKAAVIEWNKAYKAKGRELPEVYLDAERKFQEAYRDKTELSRNSTQNNSKSPIFNNTPATTAAESESSPTKRVPGNPPKNSEKKLEETTVKNAAILIGVIDKYRSRELRGDTTLERTAARKAASDAVARFVGNQPDYYFTYPVKDVSNVGPALVFSVDEPMEFESLREELGEDLLLNNHSQSIRVENVAVLKSNASIKPGDLLRVRFKVGFNGFGKNMNNMGQRFDFGAVVFSVMHSAQIGDPSLGLGDSIFSEKAIVGYQLVKQPAKTNSSQ